MISSLIMVSLPGTYQLHLRENRTFYKLATSAFPLWQVEKGSEKPCRQNSMSVIFHG